MRSRQSEGVLYSRQCNQTESAITQKVDLTTGHLVKLKTRHLYCTYSLGYCTYSLGYVITDCDWLSGQLAPYKIQRKIRVVSSASFISLQVGGLFFVEGELNIAHGWSSNTKATIQCDFGWIFLISNDEFSVCRTWKLQK